MKKYFSIFAGIFFVFARNEISSMFSGDIERLISLICVIIGTFFLVISVYLFLKIEEERKKDFKELNQTVKSISNYILNNNQLEKIEIQNREFFNSIQNEIAKAGFTEKDRENIQKMLEKNIIVCDNIENIKNMIGGISNIPESVNDTVNEMSKYFVNCVEVYYGKMETSMKDVEDKVDKSLNNFDEKVNKLVKNIDKKMKELVDNIEDYGENVQGAVKSIEDQQEVMDNFIKTLTSMSDEDYRAMAALLEGLDNGR